MPMVPSVTMNGTMPSLVTSKPFSAPKSAPDATPPSADRAGPMPARSITAVITDASAMTEPTDRSMPPLTITRVIPVAPSPTMTVWVATVFKL